MQKKIIVFLLFVFYYFIFPFKAQAEDFSSYYNVTYDFKPNGETQVIQEISLLSHTDKYYVSEYALSASGGEISEIEAYDKIGALKISTQKKDETTIINLVFNEKAAGKGKALSFILRYKVKGLALKEGNLWQIFVPKIARAEEIDEYLLQVNIPREMGKVAFASPKPKTEQLSSQGLRLRFTKESLSHYGVTLMLGQYQTFSFQIDYSLRNQSSAKRSETIALPPDTPYQTIFFQSLQPEPDNVQADDDGNWLAVYDLLPGQNLTVTAVGQVNIFPEPKQKTEALPAGRNYLQPQDYWEVSAPEIKRLADRLKTPKNIYRYVVDTLAYDYSQVNQKAIRKGALGALAKPEEAICGEFADLFVTLCRAAGIPARELVGYAHTDNQRLKEIALTNDLLHSWAEYYDANKQNWIMVDPTWEDTTGGWDYFGGFDMAHFVFVIHGIDSSIPFPPGSYREAGSKTKQIQVVLAEEDFNRQVKFSVETSDAKSFYSFKKNLVSAFLVNKSGFTLPSKTLRVSGLVTGPTEINLPVLPPFARQEFSFQNQSKELFQDYAETITFSIDETSEKRIFQIKSLGLRLAVVSGIATAGVLVLILFHFRPKNGILKAKEIK